MSDVLPLVGLTSLSRLHQANRALRRAIEDCREQLAERGRAIDAYQAVVAERERSIRQYQEIVAEHERSIARYQEIAADHERSTQAIGELQAIVVERERSIGQYQQIVAEHERSIGQYQEIAAEHERSTHAIQELQAVAAERERSILQYQEIAADYERSTHAIRELQAIVAERDQAIGQYQRIVAEREGSIARYQDIAAAHERATDAIEELQAVAAERERALGQYQQVVAEHERSIGQYQEIAAEHARSIGQYQRVVAEREQTIGQYQKIVAAQEAHLRVVDNLDHLKRQLAADAEATAELTAMQSRTVAQMQARLDDIALRNADLAAKSYVNRSLDELGEGAAELLNYATGNRGFAAQAGLQFDWPIRATFRAGQVAVSNVSERIVAIPFTLGALASCAPGSRILDFGAAGSSLPLSLASLGHEVIAFDRRPYPLQHPNLTAVVAPVDAWSGPERPVDAVVCLAAPARSGLDQADVDDPSQCLHPELLDRFRRWLRPGGLLVLSVSSGAGASDTCCQTGDADHITSLLDRWQILEQRFAIRTAPLQWTIVDGEPTPGAVTSGGPAVILIRATPTS